MINLMQSVTAFGLSTNLQEHAALNRLKRDLTTDNGEELEEKHVKRVQGDDMSTSFNDSRYFVKRARAVQRREKQPWADEDRPLPHGSRISQYA